MKKLLATFISVFLLLTLHGCFLLPAEEELPKLPLVTDYSTTRMNFETVQRGDLLLSVTLELSFVPAREDKHSYNRNEDMPIGQIYVEIGDSVSAGDLLVEIADEKLDSDISSMEAIIEKLNEDYDYFTENLWLISGAPELSYKEAGYRSQQAAALDGIYVAELRLAELIEKREENRFYSSFDGVVTYITPKETLTKGTHIISVTDEISGELYCDTEYAEHFKAGTETEIKINNTLYDAVVLRTEDAPRGGRRVFFELTGAESSAVRSGKGEITVVLDSREDVLFLPARAVISAGGESAVYFRDDSGLLALKSIIIGLETKNGIEIIDGLAEGEQVVIG